MTSVSRSSSLDDAPEATGQSKTARSGAATPSSRAAKSKTATPARKSPRTASSSISSQGAANIAITTTSKRSAHSRASAARSSVARSDAAKNSRAERAATKADAVQRAQRAAIAAAESAAAAAAADAAARTAVDAQARRERETTASETAVSASSASTPEPDAVAEVTTPRTIPKAPARDTTMGATDTAVAVITLPPKRESKKAVRKQRTLRVARAAPADDAPSVLRVEGLVKRFGSTTAVDDISLDVRAGSFYGIVGPNGAGKTTTLSMITGLLRPDHGTVSIHGVDAWADPPAAKRATGVLPDRLRLFDRLTGAQLLHYAGSLRGLGTSAVRARSADLATAFELDDALDRLVADYSVGMTKKIALACAMIHSPRLLVLDEPFESVDPVSAANLTEILEGYVAGGGTVVLSSHSMDLIERVCDSAAIIIGGRVHASGPLDDVRAGNTLEERFVELAGGRKAAEGLEWLHSFSD